MRRAFGTFLTVTVILAAGGGCGGATGNGKLPSGTSRRCGQLSAATPEAPELPPGFPTPHGVVYTEVEQAGPTTIVYGFTGDDLESSFDAYRESFPAAGYHVTREEIEERDAEVNWAGGGADGQVKLVVECEGRTDIRITIRPAG